MKVELRTETNTESASVYIQASERHTHSDSLDKVIKTLQTAKAWLEKQKAAK